MRRFAKNDNSAICNYCGKWQPTDLTNQQLEEMDWKCDECKAKEAPQSQVPPAEQDRGSKEISKYDPEYTFLVKLVKLLVKEGVSPQEIKSIADAYPFVTVDDVGDLTAKLWTLATTKYQIPREWLIKNLPKNASQKHADLWRGQEEADDMINHAPGYIAYEYGQDKTADGEFTGAEFSRDDVGVNPTLDSGPFSSPEDHGAKPQKQPFPNTDWLPADDENKDEQPYSNIASAFRPAFSKKAGLDSRYWIAPDGQEFNAGTHHGAWVGQHADILKQYGIKNATNLNEAYSQMLASGWSRASNERGFTIQVADLNHIPAYLDDFIAKHYQKGDVIRIGTDAQMVEVADPFPSLQRAINKELRHSKKAALTPQAYWIDPKGTWYTVRASGLPEMTHSGWARDNIDMLRNKYPELKIPTGDTQRVDLYRILLQGGWVRIGDSRGASYQIQTADPLHLPSSIIDWVYQNVPDGSSIEVDDANGDINGYVSIQMPVEDIQKEVALGLRRNKMSTASLKTADLSGRTVNQILNLIQTNGGTTFNMSKGNMVGTDNYAVATYPDRAAILPGIDFDIIEEYLLKNEDLLNNADNSFGAWSHDGKVYLDVVSTIPDINKAVELGKQHNQIAIWDLKNGQQISTGGTGEVKEAAQSEMLPQQLQDEIAAATSPVYNIALNNYAEAVKRGHEKDRSLKYAIESVANLEKIDPKKLVELINSYL